MSKPRVTKVEVKRVLERADELLSEQSAWIKGRFAQYKSPEGSEQNRRPQESDANCFCALGAVRRAAYEQLPEIEGVSVEDKRDRLIEKADQLLESALPKSCSSVGGVPVFNDEPKTTFRQIRNLFGRALGSL